MDYRQRDSEDVFGPLNEVLQALVGGLMSHQSATRIAEVFDEQAENLTRITAKASPGPEFTVTAEHLVTALEELAAVARGGAWLNAMLIEQGLIPPLTIEQEMEVKYYGNN